jgi:hypothetical protein
LLLPLLLLLLLMRLRRLRRLRLRCARHLLLKAPRALFVLCPGAEQLSPPELFLRLILAPSRCCCRRRHRGFWLLRLLLLSCLRRGGVRRLLDVVPSARSLVFGGGALKRRAFRRPSLSSLLFPHVTVDGVGLRVRCRVGVGVGRRAPLRLRLLLLVRLLRVGARTVLLLGEITLVLSVVFSPLLLLLLLLRLLLVVVAVTISSSDGCKGACLAGRCRIISLLISVPLPVGALCALDR